MFYEQNRGERGKTSAGKSRDRTARKEKQVRALRERDGEQRKDTGTHSRDMKGNGKTHGMCTDRHHTLK